MTLAQALFCQTRARTGDGPLRGLSFLQPGCRRHSSRRRRGGKAGREVGDSAGPADWRQRAPPREGLCHDIALKPYLGRRKVAVIDDADDLNEEGANALLKTLEEPPPRSVLILIGTTPAKQLPTIRSRCQLIRFRPLPAGVRGVAADRQGSRRPTRPRRELAELGEGSVGRATGTGRSGVRGLPQYAWSNLRRPVLNALLLAQTVAAFVDAAGKEAPARRTRLRQAVAFATDYYRRLLHAQCGRPPGKAQGRAAQPAPAAVRFTHPTMSSPGRPTPRRPPPGSSGVWPPRPKSIATRISQR